MKTEKLKTFDEVRDFLASIDRIHCGGCGISALAMYKWLKDNDEINWDFRFVLCYSEGDEKTFLNNVGVLRNRSGEAMACDHIGILYNGRFIDCQGNLKVTRYHTLQFIAYNETWFMENVLNNRKTWNNMFDRSNISRIEEALGISLNEITQND